MAQEPESKQSCEHASLSLFSHSVQHSICMGKCDFCGVMYGHGGKKKLGKKCAKVVTPHFSALCGFQQCTHRRDLGFEQSA
jgi:hypothetical protein